VVSAERSRHWGPRILGAEAMREVDRRAIEEIGLPSLVLMENAALGLVEAVTDQPEVETVAIFCGPGNNGGDGLALARQLDARGYELAVFLVTGGKELEGDAAIQQRICEQQGIELFSVAPDDDLVPVLAVAREADLIVDALFGTGLGRPLEGTFAELVMALNDLPPQRLAVDLPSGLNGTRTEVFGPCFDADLTVTFAALKRATVMPPAADRVGEVRVTNLGIPPQLLEEVEEEEGRLFLLSGRELAAELPERPPAAHKGDFGHGVILAGSPGKAGAAVLAARGAVRGGAGLVTAAVPAPLLATVDGASLESMSLPLPATDEGALAEAAVDELLAFLDDKSALALGPGLGQGDATVAAIRRLAREAPVPLVLDADGVNAFAGRAGELRERSAPTVITPHPGEMGRLLGLAGSEIQADRPVAARRAARETGALVVLKGYQTLVATPAGDVHLGPTGNPGMATGGSGDVLTGLLLALVGRLEPLPAACLGVYLHGLAGDLAVEIYGPESLAAGDLLETLPDAFEALRTIDRPDHGG